MRITRPSAAQARRAGIVILGLVATLLLAALLLLGFGWGLLRPVAERRLSAALGRPVAIARIRRVGGGLLHPVLSIEGVRIPQVPWAGSGDMVRLRAARLRIAALPLIVGKLRPQVTLVEGLRLSLARAADGRANWEREGSPHGRGGPSPDLGRLVVRDARVAIDDRQHQHRFTLTLAVDDHGFRLAGPGSIADTPATLSIVGPPVRGTGAWPFRGAIRSAAVTMLVDGTMRAPLDLGHFTAHLTSTGRDLTDLDHIIEAGLPATQPYRLSATVRHDQPAWIITGLKGTIGRSDLSGALDIRKHDDRTLIRGSLASAGFDFDDLANDAGRAKAAAEARRLGPRLFPSTRIDLSRLRMVDGTLHIDFRRLLSRTPTVFRSLKGTVTLDDGVLTAPLSAGMQHGTLAGSLVVRHQSGTPLLLANLRLVGSRMEMLHTNGIVTGPLAGRMVLRGHGLTVRDAAAHGSGRIALVGRNGAMTRRVALFLGADVGRGLFAGNTDATLLRCLVADFTVRDGIARPAPLVVDTAVARADGRGRIDLHDERVALDLYGKPKKDSLLRLNGPITASGTIERPTVNPPPQTKTAGGILKMIGKAIGGHREALATDADCAGLAAKALR